MATKVKISDCTTKLLREKTSELCSYLTTVSHLKDLTLEQYHNNIMLCRDMADFIFGIAYCLDTKKDK